MHKGASRSDFTVDGVDLAYEGSTLFGSCEELKLRTKESAALKCEINHIWPFKINLMDLYSLNHFLYTTFNFAIFHMDRYLVSMTVLLCSTILISTVIETSVLLRSTQGSSN